MSASQRPGDPPSRLTLRLPAHDLAATRDFYVRELGLASEREDAGRLLLRVGGAYLEFVQHDGPPVADEAPLLVLDCPDVASLHRRLRSFGVEVEAPPARADTGAAGSLLARDPDGRTVVLRATEP